MEGKVSSTCLYVRGLTELSSVPSNRYAWVGVLRYCCDVVTSINIRPSSSSSSSASGGRPLDRRRQRREKRASASGQQSSVLRSTVVENSNEASTRNIFEFFFHSVVLRTPYREHHTVLPHIAIDTFAYSYLHLPYLFLP